MSAQSGPDTHQRTQGAAQVLFSSTVPSFASSSSRFDITSHVTPGGIQAQLLQWHRVGEGSLRCVVAFRGTARPNYRDAVDTMADELDRLVADRGQQHGKPPSLRRQCNVDNFIRLVLANVPASHSVCPAPLTTSPHIPAEDLTPRAKTINTMSFDLRPRTSSTSSGSTIRPFTDPPEKYTALPPIPAADPDLTPKRSLASRLNQFKFRQQDVQKTPTGPEKRLSSLQRLSSVQKKKTEQLITPHRCTLDPDQGPSPSPKGNEGRYTLSSVLLLPNIALDRPKGPRELLRQDEASKTHNREAYICKMDSAVRVPNHGISSRTPGDQSSGTRQTQGESSTLQPVYMCAHQQHFGAQRPSQTLQPTVKSAHHMYGMVTQPHLAAPGRIEHSTSRVQPVQERYEWSDSRGLERI
ncbi:hypothetical protein MPH_01602 [Macrophomina phaseolina MS6]|uniref:Uncharacterized protein n=1 Tax=Macrophomina phaseolina (strain MS6) TaxID=1126212 RepID=K2S2A9_MACPH|nr:hypothetical protein MPH_01602 [Macrophomina phaseolina MS6]